MRMHGWRASLVLYACVAMWRRMGGTMSSVQRAQDQVLIDSVDQGPTRLETTDVLNLLLKSYSAI